MLQTQITRFFFDEDDKYGCLLKIYILFQLMRNFLFFIAFIFAYITACSQNNLLINGPISATPGSENIFIGRFVGNNNTTGVENIFIGHFNTGISNTTGQQNVFVGSGTGLSNTVGTFNTFIGVASGRQNTSGNSNSFYGGYAGQWNNTGGENTFIGYFAGQNSQTGSRNTFIGYYAGRNNENATDNVSIGNVAGNSNKASANIFIGAEAGFKNESGAKNTIIGYQSGYNTLSPSNTFIGYQSGLANNFGSSNTFIGESAGKISQGYGNTIIGAGSDVLNPYLYQATAIGAYAYVGVNNGIVLGNDSSRVGINTSYPQFPLDIRGIINIQSPGKLKFSSRGYLYGDDQDNIALGSETQIANSIKNSLALGFRARALANNTIILGGLEEDAVNVGIGTATPHTRLEVVANTVNSSGLRLSQLKATSPSESLTDKFLTVNSLGDVILARYRLTIHNPDQWADKVFAANYKLQPLAELEKFVLHHRHLPAIPSAQEVVTQGIDLVELNAKLLEKLEETTLYLIRLQKEITVLKRVSTQLQRKVQSIERISKTPLATQKLHLH